MVCVWECEVILSLSLNKPREPKIGSFFFVPHRVVNGQTSVDGFFSFFFFFNIQMFLTEAWTQILAFHLAGLDRSREKPRLFLILDAVKLFKSGNFFLFQYHIGVFTLFGGIQETNECRL